MVVLLNLRHFSPCPQSCHFLDLCASCGGCFLETHTHLLAEPTHLRGPPGAPPSGAWLVSWPQRPWPWDTWQVRTSAEASAPEAGPPLSRCPGLCLAGQPGARCTRCPTQQSPRRRAPLC